MTGATDRHPEDHNQAMIEVRSGRLRVFSGARAARLFIPQKPAVKVVVDGEPAAEVLELTGGEDIQVFLPAGREGTWKVGAARDGGQAWVDVTPGLLYGLQDQEPAPELTLRVQETLIPPEGLTGEAVLQALHELGVVSGIDQAAVEEAVTAIKPGRIPVAFARLPVNGEDGRVEALVPVNSSPPFTVRPDGTVDFRDREEIPTIKEGMEIARIIPPTDGSDGVDVFGRTLPARPGAPARVRTGGGARLSAQEEDRTIIALRDGRPDIRETGSQGCQVDVLPEYTHRGHVDMASGNIHFKGDVMITGDVQEGFRINAEGAVVVRGSTYGAQITAQGPIEIRGGALQSTLEARGSEGHVSAGRLQHTRVEAGSSVAVNRQGAYFSTIVCEGDVAIKGAFVGGHISAAGSVRLQEAGSRMGAETQIEVPEESVVIIGLAHPGVRVRIGAETRLNDRERRSLTFRKDKET